MTTDYLKSRRSSRDVQVTLKLMVLCTLTRRPICQILCQDFGNRKVCVCCLFHTLFTDVQKRVQSQNLQTSSRPVTSVCQFASFLWTSHGSFSMILKQSVSVWSGGQNHHRSPECVACECWSHFNLFVYLFTHSFIYSMDPWFVKVTVGYGKSHMHTKYTKHAKCTELIQSKIL